MDLGYKGENMKSNFLLLTAIAMSVLLLFVALGSISDRSALLQTSVTEDTVNTAIEEAIDSPETQQTEFEFTATMSGQIALELLEANVTIETQEFGDAGKFVTSINGLVGNNQNYWAFYLNDEYAQQGASQTILEEGDRVKFIYEAITAN